MLSSSYKEWDQPLCCSLNNGYQKGLPFYFGGFYSSVQGSPQTKPSLGSIPQLSQKGLPTCLHCWSSFSFNYPLALSLYRLVLLVIFLNANTTSWFPGWTRALLGQRYLIHPFIQQWRFCFASAAALTETLCLVADWI